MFEKYFIDAQGNLKFLYENWIDGFYISDETSSLYLPEVGKIEVSEEDISKYAGSYMLVGVNFDDTRDSEGYRVREHMAFAKEGDSDFSLDDGYKEFAYCTLDEAEQLYTDACPLLQAANNTDVKVETISDIYSMISERETTVGLLEEIKNGEEANWQSLQFDWQPTLPFIEESNNTIVQNDAYADSKMSNIEYNVGDEIVLNSTINIRTEPDSSSDKVSVACAGDTITILSKDDNGWILVKYGENQGYIKSIFIE